VLFLSHAAFWRERRDPATEQAAAYEHYFDRLIPEVAADPALRPYVVAVGPRAAFRRRGTRERLRDWAQLPDAGEGPYVHVNRYTSAAVVRELRRGTRQVWRAWRALRRSPALVEAFSHRGVTFADLALPDLAGTMLLQLPWAIRCYEEMSAVLAAARPRVVCLYAESSGWGRAAVAACRAAGVPTVAVQHGILYPKYYSYRHEPDESASPRPFRTAIFGEAAGRLLRTLGHYPPQSLVVTGSPKFDDLVRGARGRDRDERRRRLGVRGEDRLLVVASRFQAIRRTHQAIGPVFPAFVRAVESLPGVRAVVKPHPAEPPGAYDAVLRQEKAARVAVLPPSADLVELLHAADALVTVESLSAVEALVLGRPVVVLNMPSHLRELVDQGVAVGVAAGDDPAPALRRVLFEVETAARLEQARRSYLTDFAMGVDGRATARIVALLRETCGLGTETSQVAGVVG
jgi:glycosyltransferase involved in cell wall biosynthesis